MTDTPPEPGTCTVVLEGHTASLNTALKALDDAIQEMQPSFEAMARYLTSAIDPKLITTDTRTPQHRDRTTKAERRTAKRYLAWARHEPIENPFALDVAETARALRSSTNWTTMTIPPAPTPRGDIGYTESPQG